MNYLEHLTSNKEIFFNFMKKRYPLFQQSNLFFRDMQYAVISYFELKDKPIKYAAAEIIARDFIDNLVNTNKLLKLNHKTWKVNFITEDEKLITQNITEGVENE